MTGVKKALLGCSALLALLALLALGAAVALLVNWSEMQSAAAEGSQNEEQALGRELSKRFGQRPRVEFVCRLPVVDIAPCALLGEDRGTREVALTFSNFEFPKDFAAEGLAQQIAMAAHEASSFAATADKIGVFFEEGDESAGFVRRFSFVAGDLVPK